MDGTIENYDVIICGLGAMGSAAAWKLADRGLRTLGLEQFQVGHELGSSHGQTRLIRRAYFEHPDYVPLLNRAYDEWRLIEERSGADLFVESGLVIFGHPKASKLLAGVQESGKRYDIPLERLSSQEARERWQGLRPPDEMEGWFEPGAGYLRVEKSVVTMAQLARQSGAELREGEAIRSIDRSDPQQVIVKTDRQTYAAERLVISAGAWTKNFLDLPLKVHRVPLYWYPVRDANEKERWPAFGFDLPEGFLYGFPPALGLMKVSWHHPGEELEEPGGIDRNMQPNEEEQIRRSLEGLVPGLKSSLADFACCLYTMSPDEHFIIDLDPSDQRISFAAGFSGHGFKFAPVVGEALAEMACEGRSSLPIEFLGLQRFSGSAS